jgi:hypothetical protein
MEWARFAEARNVRAGGADPHRRLRNVEFGRPITDGKPQASSGGRDPLEVRS